MTTKQTARLGLVMILCSSFVACHQPQARGQRAVAEEIKARDQRRVKSRRLYEQGMEAYDTLQLGTAAHRFTKAVGVDDRNEHAWMALGVVEHARRNYYKAAEAFHQASRLAPTRFEPRFNLGSVFETVGKHDKAIDEYEAALNLSSHQVQVMENLARCYIRTKQKADRTRELIDQALIHERRPEWRAWLEKKANQLASASK